MFAPVEVKNYLVLTRRCTKKIFKLVRFKLEKKWKTIVWGLDLGQQIKNSDSQKLHAPAIGGNFFWAPQKKMSKGMFISLVLIRIEKKSLKYVKLEKHQSFESNFAASSVEWLTEKLHRYKSYLGHFQSLIKNLS